MFVTVPVYELPMALSKKLRRVLLAGVTVAAAAAACVWVDRTADAQLEPYARLLAAEHARNSERTPRVVIGRAVPGDARVALEVLLFQVQSLELTWRAKVATGDALTEEELAQLPAWRAHFPELRAALQLDGHTRKPLFEHLGVRSREVPIMPGMKLHSALAMAGELALTSNPAEGTTMILEALALGLELGHRGDLISTLVSASLTKSSCAQIERRWRDLDASQLSALAVMRFYAGEKPFSGARLHEINIPFLAATEGPGNNLLETIPLWRKRVYSAHLETLDSFYLAADRAYETGDDAACEQSPAAQRLPDWTIGAELICPKGREIRDAAAALAALKARVPSG